MNKLYNQNIFTVNGAQYGERVQILLYMKQEQQAEAEAWLTAALNRPVTLEEVSTEFLCNYSRFLSSALFSAIIMPCSCISLMAAATVSGAMPRQAARLRITVKPARASCKAVVLTQ